MDKATMSFKMNNLMFNLLKSLSIGERLLFFRTLNQSFDKDKFTSVNVSKETGIPSQTITAIERGESKLPSFHVVSKLTNYYNVSIEYITDEYYASCLGE